MILRLRQCLPYVLLALTHPAHAEITIAFGINITGAYDFGLTIKALTNDSAERYVAAVGTTFYPFAHRKAGFDIGLGKASGFAYVLYGIDFLQDAAYMSLGVFDPSSNHD